jgi:hypothetical protein
MHPAITTNRAFTPLSIPGSSWWINSTTGLTTVSSKISQWNDLSGNARHATQGTDANRPVLTASQQNGYPGAVFTRANSSYMNSGLTIANCFDDAATKKLITVALAFKTTSSGSNSNSILGSDDTNVFTSWLAIFAPFTDAVTYWDAGNATNSPTGGRISASNNFSAFSIAVFTRNGSTSKFYKNNTQVQSATVGTTYSSGAGNLLLGASLHGATPQQFAEMTLLEAAIWPLGFNTQQVGLVSKAWGSKYAIVQA